jgi:murein DD-endopeptidase MepM/ murein hydrolase activator NlpD
VADFQLEVTAETQRAEKDLQRLGKTANEATKERSIKIQAPNIGSAAKSFSDLGKNLNSAANDIKKFYGVAKQLPGIGDSIKRYEGAIQGTAKATSTLANNTKAGEILSHSFEKAGSAVGTLINSLAKVGFALFGIKEVVGILQTAFGGFFDQTIGREIKLRETILKTQTTLASTNKVFRNGQEITDPYQKIVALTGAVAKHIDSIRERSIALAGVTSNDVIEVFGIVASQVGQIGGGLKEAEDLAINFAAALGTFGIPLYQARQEIGSILRGDITTDSYLAKALGITNEDVEKAKSQVGGVTKFLEERLAAAVAGQKIAAQGFAGVVSNIKDLYELIGQRFGANLLDPLLNALASVFENLFRVKDQLFGIADAAGSALGRVAAIGREIRSRSGLVSIGEIGLEDNSGKQAINAIQDAVQDVIVLVEGAAQRSIGAIAQAIKTLKPSVITVADAFVRLGRVFIEIKVDTFESIARVLANLITAATPLLAVFTTLFNLYSRFLDLPVIKEFAKLATTMSVLKRAGMDFVTNLILVGNTIITVIVPAVGRLGIAFGVVIGGVGALVVAIGKLTLTLGGLAASLAGIPGIAAGVAKSLFDVSRNLNSTGQSSLQAGNNLGVVAGGFKNLGETAKLAGLNIVKSLGWTLLIQAAVTVLINAFGEYQKAQEEATRTERAALALERLATVYRNVGDDADYATKAARDFERALADAEYTRSIERIEALRKELNDLRYEGQLGIQTWREFFRLFDLRRTVQRALGLNPDSIDSSKLIGEEARLRKYAREYEAEQNKKRIEENIDLEAQNRVNLEKEIGDLRREIDNDLFQQRQALAQKEVEIFRVAGELRIFQMEQANAKMIEGEEGASAAALESLNTYLSTRERGELDIEASKKSLAIEVANLERQIADYRLDMEKKIFELRKRAGENDIKSAQLRRQQLEAAAKVVPGGAVSGGAVVTKRNDPDGEQTGSDISLKGGVGAAIQNPFSSLRITKVGQQGSGSGPSGRGFGNYVTGEAVLNGKKFEVLLGHLNETVVRVGDVLESGAVIGTQGITGRATGPHVSTHVNALNGGNAASVLSAIENAWVKGGTIQSRALTEAPKVEALQSAVGIPDQSAVAERYADAVRGVASALERARALQEALTNARTAAAFDAIAKAAFPKVALEEYDNQAIELQGTLDALRGISADLYDPEQIRIAVEQKSKELIADRERKQILEGAQQQLKKNNITQAEFNKLAADLAERQKQYNADLAKESEARRRNLELTKQQNAVESLKKATGAIRFDVARAGVQAQATMAQAYAGDNSTALRLIEAEQKIAEERIRLEQDATKTTADITRELTAFADKARSAATELGRMDEQVKAFVAQMTAIRDVSKTLTDGYKGMLQSVLSGGDVKEAVSQMTKTITDRLVGIALDAAFKPLEDYFVQTLKDLFGVEDPTVALQEQNNTYLDLNTKAIEANTLALQGKAAGPIPLPVTPFGGQTIDSLQAMLDDPSQGIAAVEKTLEQSFAGIGDTLTQLGTTAAQTAQGANTAATEGEKGFTKFLGGMMGLATGALSIAGGIQQMQEGGTSNTLAGIGSILLGIGGAIGGLGSMGLFGKKAGGGAVSANRPYLVGDAGPEVVVPGTSGTVMSNNQLREAMSSRASGTSAPQLNMTFQTTSIGGVEYVSREQLEAAMASTRRTAVRDGARQGMSMTIDKLRQSPGTRSRVGLR